MERNLHDPARRMVLRQALACAGTAVFAGASGCAMTASNARSAPASAPHPALGRTLMRIGFGSWTSDAQKIDESLTISITSDGKAKVSQTLFPKTYVSTIDVGLISDQVSEMLVTDENDVFLGTTKNEDSVKIATLGASTVDLKYNADTISYESGIFRLKYNSDQESRVILPPLSKIVSINTIPIEVNERNYLLPPGDISISNTIRPVTSQEFFTQVEGKEQKIETITAAKIDEFVANGKEIQFIIKDKATVLVIIPTLVLANPDVITLNNEPVALSRARSVRDNK